MGERCRICGAHRTTVWKEGNLGRRLEPEDLRISGRRYGVTLSLWKCSDCGFVFAGEDEISELVSLHEHVLDPGYEESQRPRARQMRWLLKNALREHPQAATLLDIGAGTGLLVREARAMGIDALGIEPSKALVEYARKEQDLDLLQGVYPHPAIKGRRFDLVFLVDVIEHVAHPLQLLRDGREALGSGGLLVVVTPDVSSLAARILGKRWWHYRLAHVGLFDRQSFERAASETELTAVRWFRARWYARVRYLAERTAEYLPVTTFNRFAERFAPLRWCYEKTVPLALADSYVIFLRKSENGSAGE